jgi:hypothetical protein
MKGINEGIATLTSAMIAVGLMTLAHIPDTVGATVLGILLWIGFAVMIEQVLNGSLRLAQALDEIVATRVEKLERSIEEMSQRLERPGT